MSDQRLRELERTWRDHPSVENEAALLRARLRADQLERPLLEVAALLGSPAARAVCPSLPLVSKAELAELANVAASTVLKWGRDRGCPRRPAKESERKLKGKYGFDPLAVTDWRLRRLDYVHDVEAPVFRWCFGQLLARARAEVIPWALHGDDPVAQRVARRAETDAPVVPAEVEPVPLWLEGAQEAPEPTGGQAQPGWLSFAGAHTIRFEGQVSAVRPRIRRTTVRGEIEHAYQGYVLVILGKAGEEEGWFTVAIDATAQAEAQLQAGDVVAGEAAPASAHRIDAANVCANTVARVQAAAAPPASPPPFLGPPPALEAFEDAHYLGLKQPAPDCLSCVYFCCMPLDDVEFFNVCYGPSTCPHHPSPA